MNEHQLTDEQYQEFQRRKKKLWIRILLLIPVLYIEGIMVVRVGPILDRLLVSLGVPARIFGGILCGLLMSVIFLGLSYFFIIRLLRCPVCMKLLNNLYVECCPRCGTSLQDMSRPRLRNV